MGRLVLVVATLLVSAVLALPAGQASKPPQAVKQQIDRPALAKLAAGLSTGLWQRYLVGQGACQMGEAKPAELKVCAAIMGCEKGLANSSVRWVRAGFHLPALRTAGAIPNARVSATFEVSRVLGDAWLHVGVVPGVFGSGPPLTTRKISTPDTYTVLSNPFTLDPNKDYDAVAWVEVLDLCGDLCGAVATITELKWVLGS